MKNQRRAFNFVEARNNRVRINLTLAKAKGKRARKLRERLLENGSLPPEVPAATTPIKAQATDNFRIDPSKHLTHSNTPALAQVIEVKHDAR
ncbi:hypothetical protein D9M68_877140 [compost metagenome]